MPVQTVNPDAARLFDLLAPELESSATTPRRSAT